MAIKTIRRELSEAALNAPDLDEGELDVEHYPVSDGAGIADPYLREVWALAAQALNKGDGDTGDMAVQESDAVSSGDFGHITGQQVGKPKKGLFDGLD